MTTFWICALVWYLIGLVSAGYLFYDQDYKDNGIIRIIDVVFVFAFGFTGIIIFLIFLQDIVEKFKAPEILNKVIYERKDKIEF